jgi:hypothetical protein
MGKCTDPAAFYEAGAINVVLHPGSDFDRKGFMDEKPQAH